MTTKSGISRRTLLTGLAATVAPLPLPGISAKAAAQPVASSARPRPRASLPAPVLPKVLRDAQMFARVRPHRTNGIRLEAKPVVDTPRGPRVLVHNYGHSGAGITLSWGSAAKAGDLVHLALADIRRAAPRPSIAVIGSGIIGLTTAHELRRRFRTIPITLYSKTLDVRQTTSWIAGGQFEPSQLWRTHDTPTEQAHLAGLMGTTRRWIETVLRNGTGARYGVEPRRNFTFHGADNGLDYAFQSGALPCPPAADTACRRGTRTDAKAYDLAELPIAGLQQVVAREYATWLINPMILMPRLVAELRANRVQFVAREFRDQGQLLALPHNIIVNCTGYGAGKLIDDEKHMEPRRGHLVILPNPARAPVRYFFSGGCGEVTRSGASSNFYMFGRQTDIVLGGTVINDKKDEREGIDRNDPRDREICARILENARAIFERRQPEDCIDPMATV